MKKTTGCWKKTDFFDTTKKWTLVEFFKSVGLNSTCCGGYVVVRTATCCFLFVFMLDLFFQ